MDGHAHHDDLLGGLHEQLRPVLESSAQAVYVYLDDEHKFCNEKFAQTLGFGSAEEWAKVKGSFPELFVEEKSQDALIGAYRDAMEKVVGSTSQITWKEKSGGTVDSTVILVPIAFQGHLFAMHFITA